MDDDRKILFHRQKKLSVKPILLDIATAFRRKYMASLGEPKNTIEILNKYHFMFQKKFGQNFLIDPHVLEKIIRAADITKEP